MEYKTPSLPRHRIASKASYWNGGHGTTRFSNCQLRCYNRHIPTPSLFPELGTYLIYADLWGQYGEGKPGHNPLFSVFFATATVFLTQTHSLKWPHPDSSTWLNFFLAKNFWARPLQKKKKAWGQYSNGFLNQYPLFNKKKKVKQWVSLQKPSLYCPAKSIFFFEKTSFSEHNPLFRGVFATATVFWT
jgi:hypothetical protein